MPKHNGSGNEAEPLALNHQLLPILNMNVGANLRDMAMTFEKKVLVPTIAFGVILKDMAKTFDNHHQNNLNLPIEQPPGAKTSSVFASEKLTAKLVV